MDFLNFGEELDSNCFACELNSYSEENKYTNFIEPIESGICGNDSICEFKLDPFSSFPPKNILISSETVKTNFSSENINQIENINAFNLNNEKKYLFKVNRENKKLSGRKRNLELKEGEFYIHNKYAVDNILRKVQCDYINYLIDVTNEILNVKNCKEKFLKISYDFKKDVTNDNFEKLKNYKIGEIVKMDISKKYKKIDPTTNKKLYEKVIKDKDIKGFFNETYLYVFLNYYFQNKKKIKLSGLEIDLKNIKTFEDFLNKNNDDDENGSYKEKILEVVKAVYFQKKFKIKDN
jgi:hypothetical protein